jgi:hypothetical protein
LVGDSVKINYVTATKLDGFSGFACPVGEYLKTLANGGITPFGAVSAFNQTTAPHTG